MLSTVRSRLPLLWAALALAAPQAFAQITLPGGPVVAITSPAPGASVTGTVTVSASTTISVAAVQFRLDGATLADDSSAPYSISWDSTGAGNGSHVLTAV